MPKKRYFKFESTAFNKLYSDFELNSNMGDEEIEPEDTIIEPEESLPRGKFTGFLF